MKCPNCGNENPPDYVFCDECGARLQDVSAVAGASESGAPAATGDAGDFGSVGATVGALSSGPAPVAEAAGASTGIPAGSGPAGSQEVHGAHSELAAQPGSESATAGSIAGAGESEEARPYMDQAGVPSVQVGQADEGPQMPVTEDTMPAGTEKEAASMPDVVPVTSAAVQAPAVVAYSEISEAPVTGIGAGAGVATETGTEWAASALSQLDAAQQAAARGDWSGFGEALDRLRRTLEMASAMSHLQPIPSMGAGQQAATPYQPATATGREYMHVVEPAAEPGGPGVEVGAAPVVGPAPSAEQAPARLVIISTGAELPLPDQEEITIGREDPGSGIFPDIDLTPYGGEEGGVSRRHARILRMGDEYYIEDLQSTNYTKLDGQRLPAHVRERLEDGSRLDFGRVPVIFRRS